MIAVRPLVVASGIWLCVGAPVLAQQPIKIGTRVGITPSGYDSEGRRDPFASLIKERPPATIEPEAARPKGLAGVAVVDVAVTGIITSGQTWIAIVAGADGKTYLARTNDKLYDATIRRIDRDSVVFLARIPDGTGTVVSKEIRKGMRPAIAGAGR